MVDVKPGKWEGVSYVRYTPNNEPSSDCVLIFQKKMPMAPPNYLFPSWHQQRLAFENIDMTKIEVSEETATLSRTIQTLITLKKKSVQEFVRNEIKRKSSAPPA